MNALSTNNAPSVPTLPSTGLGYEIYEARITEVNGGGDVAFQFPTIETPNSEELSFADDLTLTGFPVFEWTDVSGLNEPFLIQVSIIDQDEAFPPIAILEGFSTANPIPMFVTWSLVIFTLALLSLGAFRLRIFRG